MIKIIQIVIDYNAMEYFLVCMDFVQKTNCSYSTNLHTSMQSLSLTNHKSTNFLISTDFGGQSLLLLDCVKYDGA